MKKIISVMLVLTMLMSLCPVVFATETTSYDNGTNIEYVGNASEEYTITVPARLIPGGSGIVTLSGAWPSNRVVSVWACDYINMTNNIDANDVKKLDVTFERIDQIGSNTDRIKTVETVSVEEMTDVLFGFWEGLIVYNADICDYDTNYLQSRYQFKYYSTIGAAVADVNNGTIGENADSDKNAAVAGIYIENDKPNIVLLKDTTENAQIDVVKDMTINLGGNSLLMDSAVGISVTSCDLTIDGTMIGSEIRMDRNGAATILNAEASNVVVNGGTYMTNTYTASGFCIFAKNASTIKVSNATVDANCTSGVASAINCSNSNVIVTNCEVNTAATTGIVCGLLAAGDTATATIDQSNFVVKTDAGRQTYGIGSSGNAEVTITNSEVKVESLAAAYGLVADTNGSANANNCDVSVVSEAGNVGTIRAYTGEAEVTSCNLYAESKSAIARCVYAQSQGNISVNNCEIKAVSDSKNAYAIDASSSTIEVVGGTATATSASGSATALSNRGNASTTASDCVLIASSNGSTVFGVSTEGTSTLTNCEIFATTTNASVYGVYNNENTNTTLVDCEIKATSVNGETYGVYTKGMSELTNCNILAMAKDAVVDGVFSSENATTTITDCEIRAYSNYFHTENGEYGAFSIGVSNHGVLTVNNCYVMGTHSGVSDYSGNLEVNGGTYEGYGHGGFYFSGTGNTAYVRDAIIRDCEMPEGYIHDNGRNGSACYIGGRIGKDNISVYMNNCNLTGLYRAAVLRGSDGEQNNSLHMSNTTIHSGNIIRIDNDTHKLFIGVGCNFTAENTTLPEAVVTTEDVYMKN